MKSEAFDEIAESFENTWPLGAFGLLFFDVIIF
jgi:hypothetical protein